MQLCQIVGPPNSWMDLPAEQLDWAIEVHGALEQAKANARKEAAERG